MPDPEPWTDVLPQPPGSVPGYCNVELTDLLFWVAEEYDLSDYTDPAHA